MKTPFAHFAPLALACVAAAALLAACGSAPPVRHHSLLPPPHAQADAARTQTPMPWQLLPVAVPPQVDRPQWVVRRADDAFDVLEQDRWLAPLPDEIAAALTDALGRRLGPPAIGGGAAAAWRVRVQVLRFESLPGRLARIDAAWALLPPQATQAVWRCAASIERPAPGGLAALAAAHREAVAQLGARIAEALAAPEADRRCDAGAGIGGGTGSKAPS